MNYFFDTSALVKYFHEESGSAIIRTIIESMENEIWILDIAKIEFLCSLYRRFRDHELSEIDLNTAIEGFNESVSAFHIEETGTSVILEAENLIKQYGKEEGLRTLDALHLSSFSLLADNDWTFVAADTKLCSVALKMGHTIFNPNNK